jgi:glycogen debranching enzyme
MAREALQTLRNSPLWTPMPGRPTYPDYPAHMMGFNIKLVGITGYHDSNYWLWLTALAAMAEHRLGNKAECARILDALSDQIVRDGEIYEIFDLVPGGALKPVKRLPYRAESPFTWSSGMYLEASKADCVSVRKERSSQAETTA